MNDKIPTCHVLIDKVVVFKIHRTYYDFKLKKWITEIIEKDRE